MTRAASVDRTCEDRSVRILVTNDDGIDSIGLHVLARALRSRGEIVVAAPDSEYSGAGASLGALHVVQPEIRRTTIEGIGEAWSVTGPPALCVMFARLGAFGAPFDLVVAGINPGANVGRAVYHSGTVGAALTARAGGITGVAVSQAVIGEGIEGQGSEDVLADQHWDSAAAVADLVVGALLDAPPAVAVVVNVNVPNVRVDDLEGWRLASVGQVSPRTLKKVELVPKLGHEGAFHVRMVWGDAVVLPPETDGGAVEQHRIAISFLSPITAESTPVSGRIGQVLDGLFRPDRTGG
ncbi:MAG: hypothetical protein NVS3B21_36500 [Acidimicrobiales bacterium]